jgi:hypothetical protein
MTLRVDQPSWLHINIHLTTTHGAAIWLKTTQVLHGTVPPSPGVNVLGVGLIATPIAQPLRTWWEPKSLWTKNV